nr:hypothetical protein [Tanacetum cinerariifolium]
MGKGLLGPNGGSCGDKGGRDGSMAGRGGGWLAKCSIMSNEGLGGVGLVVCGCNSSRESKNGSEIPDETMGERGGDMMGLGGGPV